MADQSIFVQILNNPFSLVVGLFLLFYFIVLLPERRLKRGFKVYDFDFDSRDAVGTTDAALARAAELDPEQPVFLWVHYIDPHVPYHPPPELARAFDPGYEGPYALHFGPEQGAVGSAAYPKELGKEGAVYRNQLPEEVNAHVRRLYAADVRYTDDQVARKVRAALEGGLEQTRRCAQSLGACVSVFRVTSMGRQR